MSGALTYDDLLRAIEACKPDPSIVVKFVGSPGTIDRLMYMLRSITVETHEPFGIYGGIPFVKDDDVLGRFIECHNYEGKVIQLLFMLDDRIVELKDPWKPNPRKSKRPANPLDGTNVASVG